MQIVEDAWLTEIFGCAVFRIDVCAQNAPRGVAPFAIADAIKDRVAAHTRAFCYAKVDTDQISSVRELSAAGLYVVDVNVTLSIDTRVNGGARPGTPAIAIREIQPSDYEATLATAASCFRYSRFHLDPQVSASIANLIKREWIQNYILRKRGEQLFVALKDDRPVGFLAAIASNVKDARAYSIDLIGVADEHQGQGVGLALTSFFINRYRDDCNLLQVGTQAANIPSLRLYQKLGFYVSRTQYVLHGHFGCAEPNAHS